MTMADLKHGKVSIAIPKELTPPKEAGKLSPEEVQRLPKPPSGIGSACEQAASAIEKVGKLLTLPPSVTAKALREAGQRAEGMDEVVRDLDVLRTTVQQANLIFDAEAWSLVRQVKDQVTAQSKIDPSLAAPFQPVLDYVGQSGKATARRRPKKTTPPKP
jgi:hypothetical protein